MSQLNHLLADIAGQSKLYDVADVAWAAGRRRRRIRQAAMTSATSVVVVTALLTGTLIIGARPDEPYLGTMPAAPLPSTCEVRVLQAPSGFMPDGAEGVVAEHNGRFALGRARPNSGAALVNVLWDGAQPQIVDLPGAGDQLADVNAAGAVVGFSVSAESQYMAWVFRDGKLTQLDTGTVRRPPSQTVVSRGAMAFGINDSNMIVGSIDDLPVVWPTPDAEPQLLETPFRPLLGYAVGVDEDGTVVGTLSRQTPNESHAVIWDAEQVPRLLTGPGGEGLVYTSAGQIRNGWVTGQASSSTTEAGTQVEWDLLRNSVRPVRDGSGGRYSLNRAGWVVEEGPRGESVTIVAGRQRLEVPDLSGGYDYDATKVKVQMVSDDAQDLLGIIKVDGRWLPARWRCS